MGCTQEISNICVDTKNARCIDYEGLLNKYSGITQQCVNQHVVNEDLYEILETIGDSLEVSNSNLDVCMQYPLTGGKVLPKSIMEKHKEEICALKERVKNLEKGVGMSVETFNLDFKCLSSPCEGGIKDLKSLLQALINKVCQEAPQDNT